MKGARPSVSLGFFVVHQIPLLPDHLRINGHSEWGFLLKTWEIGAFETQSVNSVQSLIKEVAVSFGIGFGPSVQVFSFPPHRNDDQHLTCEHMDPFH